MNDVQEIASRLAQDALAICRRYLSNGRREGGYWRVGDIGNTPGRSLYVRLDGRSAGRWRDAATGERGDLLDLISAVEGRGGLGATLELARRHLSFAPTPRRRGPEQASRDSSTAAQRLFAMSKPIGGTPAGAYLRGRGITAALSPRTLRFHPACWYRPAPGETVDREAWPAMIAAVTDLAGAVTGVQRTWLDPSGAGKANLTSPRRSLGVLHGHGVRFGTPGDTLLAGEGIETMLSFRTVLPTLPTVAALSAAHLAGLQLPPGLRRLYVARDRDAAGASAASARRNAGITPGWSSSRWTPARTTSTPTCSRMDPRPCCAPFRASSWAPTGSGSPPEARRRPRSSERVPRSQAAAQRTSRPPLRFGRRPSRA